METIKKTNGAVLKSASMEEWLQQRKDSANKLSLPLANHLECQVSAINYFIQEHYANVSEGKNLVFLYEETKKYIEAFDLYKSLIELDNEMTNQLEKVRTKTNKIDKTNSPANS